MELVTDYNAKVGLKVVRNPTDWIWEDQDAGFEYGVIKLTDNKELVFTMDDELWVDVQWIKLGYPPDELNSYYYRVGKKKFDLLIYEEYSIIDIEKDLEKLEKKIKK